MIKGDDIPLGNIPKATKGKFSVENLIELTGVYGIHSQEEIKKMGKAFELNFFYDENFDVCTQIKTTHIEDIIIILKRGDKIYIELFKLRKGQKRKYLGYYRLKNQIAYAIQMKFKKITLWAYGSYNQRLSWDGYLVWGKYGFSMYDKGEITLFQNKMNQELVRTSRNINQLVSSDEGSALWRHIGYSWKGEFNLDLTSPNMDIFDKFARARSLP